jgi:hypothetical protein
MRRALVIAAAAAALSLVGGAGAARTNAYMVGPGDSAYVRGTPVACTVSLHKQILCLLRNAHGPIRGSYLVNMHSSFAGMSRITASGKIALIAKKNQPGKRSARLPAGNRASTARVLHVSAGDQLNVRGTSVWCTVNRSQPVSVSCFKLSSALATVVGTYAVVIDNAHAGLLKVTSSQGSGQFKVLLFKKQP